MQTSDSPSAADTFNPRQLQAEKNEFCLKLSIRGTDKSFVAGMKSTLQGLLLEASPKKSESVPAQNNSIEAESCLSPGQSNDSAGGIHESMMSDSGWSPISAESEEQETIQPLDYSERIKSAVQTRAVLNPPRADPDSSENERVLTEESASRQAQNSDDDNMWMKFGGGIAVLGAAVVGGAFLAMQQDNTNSGPREGGGAQANQSTVTIEQLDDEDETAEEWENTAASHQAQ